MERLMFTDTQKMRKLMESVPDQRSTYDQLVSLHELANQNGLYDAADWLKSQLEQWKLSST